MNIKKLISSNKFEIFVFIVICLLMLSNFSNMYLWDDEGETAMLAKNILLFGVPKVYDGKNLVTNNKKDYNSDLVWTWSSWLHFYVAAFSFMMFGMSTFSARILFVLIGIISFFPIVALFRKISISKMHYNLSVLSLMFFVPYYLYSRQSRYYALIIFLIPIILLSVYNLIFRSSSLTSIIWFVMSSALLFHSNYLSFFVIMLALAIYILLLIWRKTLSIKKIFKWLAVSCALIFVLTFPWALYANIFQKISVRPNLIDFILRKIYYVLHDINYTVPILLILASAFIAMHFYLKQRNAAAKQKIMFSFANGILPIIILFFLNYVSVRYLIGLFPLWISFTLLPVIFLMSKNKFQLKIAGAIIFFLMVFTSFFYSASFYFFVPFENMLQQKCITLTHKQSDFCILWIKETFIYPRQIKFPFFSYIYEITHDYDGPIEGIVNYLNQHGNENSIVFANNWHFSIAFYTNMKVFERLEFRDANLKPDFIFVNMPNRKDNKDVNYLVSYAEGRNYKKVTLPYPDLPWDNRPELWYHKYWTQPIEVPVTIYVKQER